MSKVNVDEIKVGDLVETVYGKEKWLCYITRLDIKNMRYKGVWSDNFKEEWDHMDDLTGHWKVINFDELPESPFTDEETKMDELKVYTGKEALQELLNGKILKEIHEYKLEDNEIFYRDGGAWSISNLPLQTFLNKQFTEVVTPQVGDWVRVTTELGNKRTGQITETSNSRVWATWDDNHLNSSIELNYPGRIWEILSPEQVSEYKREQAFAKVGRKLNEFKPDDIVYVESLGEMAIVVSNMNDQEVRLHKVNIRAGLTAKPHQLTPISFIEQQVDLS